jgi:hypothetical protein
MKKLLLCLFLIGQYGVIHTALFIQDLWCKDFLKTIQEFFKEAKKIDSDYEKDLAKVNNNEMLFSEFVKKYSNAMGKNLMVQTLEHKFQECQKFDWFREEVERLDQELDR